MAMEKVSRKYAPCVNPFLVRKSSVDLRTGELKFAEFEKRCGTRRKELCESCSQIWKDDAFFALLKGAKKHDGNLTFITLTAPGSLVFGKSHTAQHKNRASERCACRKYHKPEDELVGLPITKLPEKAKKFQYKKVVEFNHYAPRLTAITLQKIWRQMATDLGKTESEVKLPYARVMEWQQRGTLHVHIIVLGHIPTYIVERAVLGSPSNGKRRRINPSEHAGYSWGEQFDVRHINSSQTEQIKKLSSYVTKLVSYAVKDVSGDADAKTSLKEIYHQKLRQHTNVVIKCRKSWSKCSASDTADQRLKMRNPDLKPRHYCVKHRRGRHQLGFTGNVLSMSRKWGSSLKESRDIRKDFMKGKESLLPAAKAGSFKEVEQLITQVVVRKHIFEFQRLIAESRRALTVRMGRSSLPPTETGVQTCFSQLTLQI